jgi:hypothetical protein
MRRIVLPIVAALLGTGCVTAHQGTSTDAAILIERSPAPFNQITAGPVSGVVPDGWNAVPAGPSGGLRNGFIASPSPRAWGRMDGSTAGIAATWIDATRVGVPSDYYYLAATGPLFGRLVRSSPCRLERHRVLVDNRPTFLSGNARSAGDYVATGQGRCEIEGQPTRWAFFVAAPGFGPVRRVGIPSSGLYVVVAVLPDSRRAATELHRMIRHTSFGGDRIGQIVAAL